jgi:Cu+-exporting ATPase
MEMEAYSQSNMSTMVGDESAQSGTPAELAVPPAEAGLRVEWTSEPANPQPGQPVTLAYRVVDEQNGDVVSNLPLDHERPMHLIMTSRDLTQFQHIHPELGDDGVYRVEATLPEAGTYLLYDEFVHDGQTVLDRRELTVGAPSSASAALTVDLAPQTVEGFTVALNAPVGIQAGGLTHFSFTVTREGQSVTDLAPYLGAAAHVAIVSEDAETFAHTHGEAVVDAVESAPTEDDHAAEGDAHAIPAAFGPEVQVEHVFPNPGRYKVWAQFSQDGRVLTVPFIIEVQ